MIQKILAFSFLVVATASVANPPVGMPSSSQSEKPNSASSSSNGSDFYSQFYGRPNQPTPGKK